jgi:hypothetical protein
MAKSIHSHSKHNASLRAAGLVIALVLALSFFTLASAHQTVTVGEYDVEYGWYSEPAVAGQPNAVVLNLNLTGAAKPADVDTSGLKVEVLFGGQSKMLSLQPLGEDTPGQFVAPVTPMRPGTYTIHLSGQIGKTTFNNDVVPEEVQTADLVQFPVPQAATADPLGMAGWLGILGIILGLLGILLGLMALFRRSVKA